MADKMEFGDSIQVKLGVQRCCMYPELSVICPNIGDKSVIAASQKEDNHEQKESSND
jgi:hypothetical protein